MDALDYGWWTYPSPQKLGFKFGIIKGHQPTFNMLLIRPYFFGVCTLGVSRLTSHNWMVFQVIHYQWKKHRHRKIQIWAIHFLVTWLNPPIWKICSSNWMISPGRVEHKKSLSCHHLDSKSVTWIAILGRIPVLFTTFLVWLFGWSIKIQIRVFFSETSRRMDVIHQSLQCILQFCQSHLVRWTKTPWLFRVYIYMYM